MSSLPTLKELGMPAEISKIPAETFLDVRARRLDDGLCCLTEDAALQLHQRKCNFFVGVTIVVQRQASNCSPS